MYQQISSNPWEFNAENGFQDGIQFGDHLLF